MSNELYLDNDKYGFTVDHYKNFKANSSDLIFPELKRLDDLNDSFKTQKAIAFAASRIDKCLRIHVAKAAGVDKDYDAYRTS